ncbi:addiction module protein [Prosthecobacter sp. SYSU 5D2]|uniref:addiction module protein n=1 Tax=Prosthecobacter sp. SYSU 5D2 TaxID=3134134 RepID=UPI0031FEB37F
MPSALTMDSLLTEAMTWPLEDRLEAAERLVASVPGDAAIEEAQLVEVHRRIARDRSGETVRVSGPEALKQVRRAVLGGS